MSQSDFIVSKETIFSVGRVFSHVLYDSLMDGHNRFWESKNALKKCKEYAKANGFTRVIVLSKTIRTKDRIYDL